MLLAEMDTFKNFRGDRGEFEYINYQTFWEIYEYFNDREGAAKYYSLYLLNNPAIPRAESLYYEKFIENRDNRAYIQGMRYKN